MTPPATSPETGSYALSELAGLVGTELAPGDWFVVDQNRVDRFADATDDHQWIHQEGEAARQGPYGGPIAHGFLIQSLFAGQWQQILAIRDADAIINYGTNRVRFLTPVIVGSALRLRLRVDDVIPIPNGADLHLTVTFELQGSDKPACVMQQITRIVGTSSTAPDGSERN